MICKTKTTDSPALPFLNGWGGWFWIVFALGLVIRLYLVFATEGSFDMPFWGRHAAGVREYGLIGYYHTNPEMNHPPFISEAAAGLQWLAQATDIPFRILWRLPFALLDIGTLWLLLELLRDRPRRLLLAACYWLNPLAMIFSAYHGNTDSAIPFFILLSLRFLSKEQILAAGIALGAGFWIKLPVLLAIPALFFAISTWRNRGIFLAVVGVTALIAFLPALVLDTPIVLKNVFGYHGQIIHTTGGLPVWGGLVLVQTFLPPVNQWPPWCVQTTIFLLDHGWHFALLCLLAVSWKRREDRSNIGLTLAMGFTFVHGFSNNWAFQYFAWTLPFWVCAPAAFFIPATVIASGYIYLLYAFLCGSPWLLGTWDFIGHPYWPGIVVMFRNLSVLFFFLSAWVFLGMVLKKQRFSLI